MVIRIFTLGLFFGLLGLLQSPVYAASYKCFSKDIDIQEKPHEIEVSTDPIGFKLTSFYKDESGGWIPFTELLADWESVRRPVQVQWARCQVSTISNENEFAFTWHYNAVGAGHLNLNLQAHTGEFYSSFEMGGNIYRLVRFYGCTN